MSKRKKIVLTGTTTGLGLALARELLRAGHELHGCGRRGNPLTDKEADSEGQRYFHRQVDVTDRASLSKWAADVTQAGPPIDYLIHNAAVIHGNANLWEIDQESLQAVLDINILGTFNVLRAFLPQMVAKKHGILITLSSGAGRIGLPGISGYCASKWAVEGLTKSLAEELPDEMVAIPLSPGIVDTEMLRSNFGERADQHWKPEAWAKVAAPYILTLNRSHNGQSLTIPEQ